MYKSHHIIHHLIIWPDHFWKMRHKTVARAQFSKNREGPRLAPQLSTSDLCCEKAGICLRARATRMWDCAGVGKTIGTEQWIVLMGIAHLAGMQLVVAKHGRSAAPRGSE